MAISPPVACWTWILAVAAFTSGCAATTPDELQREIGARQLEARLASVRTFKRHDPSDSPVRWSSRAASLYAVLTSADATKTPTGLVHAAEAELLAGRVEKAVELLARASELAPELPQVLIDLAAAQVPGPDDALPVSTLRALDAAIVAAQSAPEHAAAWFNLRLVAGRLSLEMTGASARRRLKRYASEPGWLDESDRLADRLARSAPAERTTLTSLMSAAGPTGLTLAAAVQADPFGARELLLRDFIPAIGRRAEGVTPEGWLPDRVEAVVSAVTVESEDPFLRDCVRPLRGLAAGDVLPGNAAKTLAGLLALEEGRRHYEANRRDRANDYFQKAHVSLLKSGSACEALAELQLALRDYQASAPSRSLAVFRRIREGATKSGYTWLRARARHLEGVAHLAMGDPDRALQAYQEALAGYRQSKDFSGGVGLSTSAADGLRQLGAHREGWRYLAQALEDLALVRDERLHYLTFFAAALYASDLGAGHAALEFQHHAVAAARRRGTANTVVEGLVHRARRYMDLDRPDLAREDLREARQRLSSIESRSSSEYVSAWLVWTERLMTSREPSASLPGLPGDLFDYFLTREAIQVPLLYRDQSRIWSAAGQRLQAMHNIELGLQRVDAIYSNLTEDRSKVTYSDSSWNLVADLMGHQLDSGDTDGAFRSAERSRLRRPFSQDVAGPEQIARTVTPGSAILYFVTLPDRLLIWRMQAGAVEFIERRIPSTELNKRVVGFRRAIEGGQNLLEVTSAAQELHRLLIDDRWLATVDLTKLVIVPDGALHGLPFTALVDSRGRYLIEQVSVAIALSASTSGAGRASVVPIRPGQTRALVVAPGQGLEEGRSPLPGAMDEARALMTHLPGSRLLQPFEATATEIGALAGQFDAIHFGGHAEADLEFPWSSFLLTTADEQNPTGRLRSGEISTWSLARTKLVVLAGCQTALGSVFRGYGVANLLRPFFEAGVPFGVGSLWNIDDATTSILMATFYEELMVSGDPVSALRKAQLMQLQNLDPSARLPRGWAGLMAVLSDSAEGTQAGPRHH